MTTINNLSLDNLKSFIERIERLEEEKKNIADDIKAVFLEAKGQGFDVKTIRQILKIKSTSESELEEQGYLLETYLKALGMVTENE